jgi:hypothetical protein
VTHQILYIIEFIILVICYFSFIIQQTFESNSIFLYQLVSDVLKHFGFCSTIFLSLLHSRVIFVWEWMLYSADNILYWSITSTFHSCFSLLLLVAVDPILFPETSCIFLHSNQIKCWGCNCGFQLFLCPYDWMARILLFLLIAVIVQLSSSMATYF